MKLPNSIRMPWGEVFDDVYVQVGHYSNGQVALQLFSDREGPLAKPTVNLSEYGINPSGDNATFVRSDGEYKGLPEELARQGVVSLTTRSVAFGYKCSAREVIVNPMYLDGE